MTIKHSIKKNNQTQFKECYNCKKYVDDSDRFYCPFCINFNVCKSCKNKFRHKHIMKDFITGEWEEDSPNDLNPTNEETNMQKKDRSIVILTHAENCELSEQCRHPMCAEFKRIWSHFRLCKRRASDTCQLCKKVKHLMIHHVKYCNDAKCALAFCRFHQQQLALARSRSGNNQNPQQSANARPLAVAADTSNPTGGVTNQTLSATRSAPPTAVAGTSNSAAETASSEQFSKLSPDQFKFFQELMIALLHAHRCKNDEKNNPSAKNCTLQNCKAMKRILNHLSGCNLTGECATSLCQSSRSILTHVRVCKKSDCQMCSPINLCRMYNTGQLNRPVQLNRTEKLAVMYLTRNGLSNMHVTSNTPTHVPNQNTPNQSNQGNQN